MKKSLIILLAGVVLAVVTCLICYRVAFAPHSVPVDAPAAELAWLKREFRLNDAEFARISTLHEAYRPRCRENCRQVDETNAHLKKLLASGSEVTPEIEAALAEAARLRVHCQLEMLQHFHEVSRAMSPEQGRRYLEWVQEQTLMPPAAGVCPAPAPLMRHGN